MVKGQKCTYAYAGEVVDVCRIKMPYFWMSCTVLVKPW